MTAVHEARQGGSLRHTPDQFGKDCVVPHLTSRLVVDRDQGLVESILLVIVVVGETTTVAGVMEKGAIATFGRCSEFLEGSDDIGVGRRLVGAVILMK